MSTPGDRSELDAILASYMEQIDRGEQVDFEEFLDAHSEYASELREYFETAGLFERLRKESPGEMRGAHEYESIPVSQRPSEPRVIPTCPDLELTEPLTDSRADTAPIQNTGIYSTIRYFGDYELIGEIARGGMGVVYKANQTKLNRVVALKMILAGQLASDDDVKRFYTEAEAAANLDHPGIVPIHEIGEHDGQHYFSMSFVEGDSLAARIKDGPLPPREAAEITKNVAEAIAYAHDRGVIHRDLKPGNILMDVNGEPRVTDFGLAKRVEGDSDLTATGQILGTPSYMPPEQAAGKIDEIDERSDVYSLGAILYALITGRPPFQAANAIDTLMQVIEQEPVAPSVLNGLIPRDLETVILRSLDKDQSHRYKSAEQLVEELSRFLNGEPIHARSIGKMERSWRWCNRNPTLAVACTAVLLLAVGGPTLAIQLIVSNKQTATARADALLNASPAAIPVFLSEIDRDISVVESRLREQAMADLSPSQRLRLGLALLPVDSGQLTYLLENLPDCSYEELAVTVERLNDFGGRRFVGSLWQKFHDAATTRNERFRAGLALATLDPESDQWTETSYQFLVSQLLSANTLHQQAIRHSLHPIAGQLLALFAAAFQDRESSETVRESAANAIVDFAGNDAHLLTDFAMKATPRQFLILYPAVAKHAAKESLIVDKLVDVTNLQPTADLAENPRVALGKRRSGASICLLRMGFVAEALNVLRVTDDPESLTQFVYGCKDRGVTVIHLLDLLGRAQGVTERYGLLLALGEFSVDEIPVDIRSIWLEHLKDLYANDPSSGIHGVCGWLLRKWGLTKEATAIEEREVPYSEDRQWFTFRINLARPLQFENYSYFTFVVFPAGEYLIGSPKHESDRDSSDEAHRVAKITRAFAVLDREVTRAEFNAVTGFRGSSSDRDWQRTSAMSDTSWYMAVEFCRRLTARLGLGDKQQAYLNPSDYEADRENHRSSAGVLNPPRNWPLDLSREGFRLPTAAEWEIGCRCGAASTYNFGSDVSCLARYAWYVTSSNSQGHRPRELRPNIRGLFDMHGNMWEWCHDWAGVSRATHLTDPRGPDNGVFRVVRGGGWVNYATLCRSALRGNFRPIFTAHDFGFRVVLSLSDQSSYPR